MLKSIVKIQFILLAAFLLSCGDDDEDGKEEISFKNQDTQGKVLGANWTYTDGHWRIIPVNEEDELAITLYPAYDESLCNALGNYGNFVTMAVPPQIGLYKLNNINPDLPVIIVSFFDVETGGAVFVLEGAIEILTITETEVTGRIHASKDSNNYINGNFRIPICIADSEP